MTSPAQFAANRLNAQKSTGPITPAGKARAARSSLWHGLTAASLVVLDEDEADFDNFHTWLVSDLKPVGELEYSLVERIAVLSWRLRRVAKAEAALINRSGRYKGGYPVPADQPEPADTDAGTIFDQAVQKVAALSRHEASIERALNRVIVALERRQRRREEQDEWEAEEPEDRILRPGDPDYPKPGDKLYMGRPEDWLDEK